MKKLNLKQIMAFAKKMDWKGLAKAYQESEISLAAEEWKKLFELIRKDERQKLKEKIKEMYPRLTLKKGDLFNKDWEKKELVIFSDVLKLLEG